MNTIKLDFGGIPKPNYQDIHKFVEEKLKMRSEEVVMLQVCRLEPTVYIKANSLEVAVRVIREATGATLLINEKQYKIPLTMADGVIEVRAYDAPEETTEEEISKLLSKYGEIKNVKPTTWASSYNYVTKTGEYIVRMKMTSPIPSTLILDEENKILITYQTQSHLCRFCSCKLHPGIQVRTK